MLSKWVSIDYSFALAIHLYGCLVGQFWGYLSNSAMSRALQQPPDPAKKGGESSTEEHESGEQLDIVEENFNHFNRSRGREEDSTEIPDLPRYSPQVKVKEEITELDQTEIQSQELFECDPKIILNARCLKSQGVAYYKEHPSSSTGSCASVTYIEVGELLLSAPLPLFCIGVHNPNSYI